MLPTIARSLGGGSHYTCAVCLDRKLLRRRQHSPAAPAHVFSQVSNVLGRLMPSLMVVALLALPLGSRIAGGIRCGGILALKLARCDIPRVVVCNLAPLAPAR